MSERRARQGKLVDWFDFQAYFKKKLLPTEEIEKRWGAAVAAGVVDYEGDNPSYPERVRLKTKDFFQEFDEAAVTNQCRKEGAVSKGDAAVANLAATLEAPEEDGQGPGKGSGGAPDAVSQELRHVERAGIVQSC
ncbi:unnamed protein product [Effrenium voratum]|nr:unnamed protein product [Effrenium voratum]